MNVMSNHRRAELSCVVEKLEKGSGPNETETCGKQLWTLIMLLDEGGKEPMCGQTAHVTAYEISVPSQDDLIDPGDPKALTVIKKSRIDARFR